MPSILVAKGMNPVESCKDLIQANKTAIPSSSKSKPRMKESIY